MIISSISKDPKTCLCDARFNITISQLQLKVLTFVPETDGTKAFDHWLHRMAACNAELKPGMNPAAIAMSGLGWRKLIYNMDLLQLPKMSKFIYSTVFILVS